MRLKIISCRVFYREVCRLVAELPHATELEFLPIHLHDRGGAAMREVIQERIDAVPAEPPLDAIVLGFGLCNNGLVGLTARHCPLVVPRAHDCITVFLSSRRRYQQVFEENPGTYYLTSGWIEGKEGDDASGQLGEQTDLYGYLVDKYGEDNAEFLLAEFSHQTDHYNRYAYIPMGLPTDEQFRQVARQRAKQRGWDYTEVTGDLGLLRRLLGGDWRPDEVLQVAPGQSIAADLLDGIVKAEAAAP